MTEKEIDSQLVLKAQEGNRAAFDVLVLKYQHRVAKLISRYIVDYTEVLDLTQETFIKAFEALDSFRRDSAFYTWLYRIAINTVRSYVVAKRARFTTETTVDTQTMEQSDIQIKITENEGPEQLLIRDEVADAVFDAVNNLPDELRTAIILREIEGFSYEEIAVIMECPVGTVRSRIFRARETIDGRIDKFAGEQS